MLIICRTFSLLGGGLGLFMFAEDLNCKDI